MTPDVDIKNDYPKLLSLFIELVESQNGKPIKKGEGWRNDAQTLAIKMFFHLATLQQIVAGTSGKYGADLGKEFGFTDPASANVVTRAAFETYLVWFYIYINDDDSLSQFRHSAWRLAGLVDRQELHPLDDESRAKVEADKPEIDGLREILRMSPHLNAYSEKQGRKILEGDWRNGLSWAELAKRADFHELYFRNVYKHLCGYSHASYISAMQVGQATTAEDQRGLATSMLGVGLVLMAHFSRAYVTLNQDAEAVFGKNPEWRTLADRWRADTAAMDRVYKRQSEVI